VPHLCRTIAADAQLPQQRSALKEKQPRPPSRGIQQERNERSYKGRTERQSSAESSQSEQKALRAQIEATRKSKDWQKARVLIAEARINGPVLNAHVYSAAITVMARCKQMQAAVQLFTEMQEENIEPSPSCYNSLMNACITTGELHVAMQYFREMQQRNVKPDQYTYNTLIKGHCLQLDVVEQLFEAMKQNAVAPNAVTFSTLITVYRDSGHYDKAWLKYDEIIASGVLHTEHVYSALILFVPEQVSQIRHCSCSKRCGSLVFSLQPRAAMH
jgi:pentatricopeptide repeat protein